MVPDESFTAGNAVQEAKDIADDITLSNEEDGALIKKTVVY